MSHSFEADHDSKRGAARKGAATLPSGRLPTHDMTALLLHLQRTAGNRAVNRLLHRWASTEAMPVGRKTETPAVEPADGTIGRELSDRIHPQRGAGSPPADGVRASPSFVQRTPSSAPTTSTPASAGQAAQPVDPAQVPSANPGAVILWHDTVVEPLTAAQAAFTKGPANAMEAMGHAAEAGSAIQAVEETFAQNPLAEKRLEVLYEKVSLAETELGGAAETAEGGAVGLKLGFFDGLMIGNLLDEAMQDATGISPTLDPSAKTQAGGATQPNPAGAMWDTHVLGRLTSLQTLFSEVDPAVEGSEDTVKSYSGIFLPQLEKVKKIVYDLMFSITPDEPTTLTFNLLILKLNRLIAMLTINSTKKVAGSDITHWLDSSVEMAQRFESRLGAGSLDMPTPAPAAAPGPIQVGGQTL